MYAAIGQRGQLTVAFAKQHDRFFENKSGLQRIGAELVIPAGDIPAVAYEIVISGRGHTRSPSRPIAIYINFINLLSKLFKKKYLKKTITRNATPACDNYRSRVRC